MNTLNFQHHNEICCTRICDNYLIFSVEMHVSCGQEWVNLLVDRLKFTFWSNFDFEESVTIIRYCGKCLTHSSAMIRGINY